MGNLATSQEPGLSGLRLLTAWIGSHLVDEMRAEAGAWAPSESGGVMMGYWAGPTQVVVTDLVEPGPGARHETGLFAPDYDFQERAVAGIYESSNGRSTYLGDWHSHPGGGLVLSRKDRVLLSEIAQHRESRARRPVMAVLAGQESWQLAIWSRLTLGRFGRTVRCSVRIYRGPR